MISLSQIFLVMSILGVILYIPLRSHWNPVFSIVDVFVILGCSVTLAFMFWGVFIEHMTLTTMEMVTGGVIGIGCLLVGGFFLISCWSRCGSILDVILMPFIMIMLFGAFVLVFLMILIGVGGESDAAQPFWYWDRP